MSLFLAATSVLMALVQVLLFSISMPTYLMVLASRKSENHLDNGDIAFSGAMIAFVALSFLADQQQWSECTRAVLLLDTDSCVPQIFKMQNTTISKLRKTRVDITKKTLTGASTWLGSGLGAAILILQPSSLFGSRSMLGPAM